MGQRKKLLLIGMLLLAMTAVSCAGGAETPFASPLGPTASAPVPTLTTLAESPIATPPSLPTEMQIPFQLKKPVAVGDGYVEGSGPPGVPILIADVTFMGTVLGSTTIDQQGTFRAQLAGPAEAKHRIGIALGDLQGTEWSQETFQDELFYGAEPLLVPTVGFFYDTFLVGPEE